jgi:hypothetical protein
LHWALSGTYVTSYIEGLELTLTADIRGESVMKVETDWGHEMMVDLLLGEDACAPWSHVWISCFSLRCMHCSDHGASINVVNEAGQTPLTRAIRGGCTEEALKLLKLGESLVRTTPPVPRAAAWTRMGISNATRSTVETS